VLLRPHRLEDREGCLAAFDSNVPAFFAPSERSSYVEYLDEMLPRSGVRQLVLQAPDGAIVASGGVGLRDGEARMCWGIVRASHHRRHLGECFLLARLLLGAAAGADRAGLDTIPKTTQFFARYGFVIVREQDDGYGPGIHRRDMCVTLDLARVAALRSAFATTCAGLGVQLDQTLAGSLVQPPAIFSDDWEV